MTKERYYEDHRGLTEPGLPVISREYRLTRGGEEVRLHWHEGVELIHVLEGSCIIWQNLHTCQVTQGETAIISAGALHRIYVEEQDVRYEYMILERELWEELSVPPGKDQFQREALQDEGLGWMVGEYARLRDYEGSYHKIQRRGLLFLIMGRLLECYSMEKGGDCQEDKRIPCVRRAIAYMEENYRRALSIEELAQAAGYSKYHFCRCFKTITGMTPVEYASRLRCERVKRLLLGGNTTVLEAAMNSGFSNMAHFYRTYKKYMGHLPSEDVPS